MELEDGIYLEADDVI